MDDATTEPTPAGASVSHLADHGSVRVRIARDDPPFDRMSDEARKRLIVRVLCELVAYGAADGTEQARAS